MYTTSLKLASFCTAEYNTQIKSHRFFFFGKKRELLVTKILLRFSKIKTRPLSRAILPKYKTYTRFIHKHSACLFQTQVLPKTPGTYVTNLYVTSAFLTCARNAKHHAFKEKKNVPFFFFTFLKTSTNGVSFWNHRKRICFACR